MATTVADAQRWYNLEGQYSTISVAAEPGVTPDTLGRAPQGGAAGLRRGQDLGPDAWPTTPRPISDAIGNVLRTILLAFGGVAVIVGAFIIFNAFSITVAQRIREFAMLRSLGATRRQVLASVIGEAGALGLVASLLGIAAGIGIAKGINALFQAVGADIPTSGIALAPRTIIVSLIVGDRRGSGRRAGARIAGHPGAARGCSARGRHAAAFGRQPVRPGHCGRCRRRRARLPWRRGMFVHGPTTTRLLEMALGAVLIFVAVAMVAKYVVRPLASVIGWPGAKLAGSSGRLARENATRNPARTAATAAALMIGLAVVVFVAVFAQGFKTSFVSAVDRSLNAAIVVSGQSGQTVPDAALSTRPRRARRRPGGRHLLFDRADQRRRARRVWSASTPSPSVRCGTSTGSRAAPTPCSAV